VATNPKHPAKFSAEILAEAEKCLVDHPHVLDPFAGVGLVHQLSNETVGVELEPEWADAHPDTIVGDATNLPFARSSFDAVFTSPTYGNRLADHHNAQDGSVRRSYRHDLGHELSPNNSGQMQWGEEYRQLHRLAWREVRRVVQPGGRFILNLKNHIRGGVEQPVVEWHLTSLIEMGWVLAHVIPLSAKGMRYGQNYQARLEYEFLLVFDQPPTWSV